MAASSRRVRSAGLFLFFAASFVAAVYSWAAPLGDWLGTGEKGSGSVRLSHLASDTEGGGHGSGKGVPFTESLGPNGKAWKSEEAKRGRRTFLLAVDNRSPLDLPISASNYLATCAAVNWYYANVVFPLIASKDAAIAQETFSYAYYIANVSCPDQGACGWTEEAGKGGTAVAGEGAVGAGGKEVHPAWIAIKAALQLLPTMAEGDIGILADTDVFVDVTKHTTFYHSVLPKLEGFLDGGRPVGLLRDGSFWRAKARGYGYKIDVQSGIIFFVKTKERTAEKFFRDMWKSASKPSPAELLLQDPFKFLKQWPWMQVFLESFFRSCLSKLYSFSSVLFWRCCCCCRSVLLGSPVMWRGTKVLPFTLTLLASGG